MTNRLLGAAVLTLSCVGCGPTELTIDPRAAVDVQVRPTSGQALFCPGDAFEIELVAKLKDGSTCSNVDETRECAGQKGVLDSDLVKLEASAGEWVKNIDFTLAPPADPLQTAGGLVLRGWLEGPADGATVKSVVGERELKPVYSCLAERLYQRSAQLAPGTPGANGPALTIAVTTLSTPYYPNAALVRIEDGASVTYLVSPSADQPIRITSRGQDGAAGAAGTAGEAGAPGAAGAECAAGTDGAPGKDGGAGGKGGKGGDGGAVTVIFDGGARDRLESRVVITTEPGKGGPPGAPGLAGPGGEGGAAGAVIPACEASPPAAGNRGALGKPGAAGEPGPAGAAGPAPVLESRPRDELFAKELQAIQKIEASPGKKQ